MFRLPGRVFLARFATTLTALDPQGSIAMEIALLDSLKSDEFQAPFLFAPSPSASYRMLQKAPEIARIREALVQGSVSETDIRTFASELMRDLHKGERFPHDGVLAAIAVALEASPTPFADEYLNDLANL